jgi:hypothetical protein
VRAAQYNRPAALTITGDAEIDGGIGDALQFQRAVKGGPFIVEHGFRLRIRFLKGGSNFPFYIGIIDDEKIPGLHVTYRWRVMGGQEQTLQNLWRNGARLKLAADIAPCKNGAIDGIAFFIGKWPGGCKLRELFWQDRPLQHQLPPRCPGA